MFPEQRWDLVHYGRLLFVDGTHGTTHHDWPLFTPATINSFNRLRAVGYCLVDSECGPAQSWMLECMRRAEPSWIPHVIFNDSKLAEASITHVFPDAQVFLCWWHIVQRLLFYELYFIFIFIHNCNVFFYSFCDRDMDKKDNLGGDRQVDDIRAFVKNEFVFGINAATIDAKWKVFQRTFSERATEYMHQWMEKRFCVPIICVSYFCASIYACVFFILVFCLFLHVFHLVVHCHCPILLQGEVVSSLVVSSV